MSRPAFLLVASSPQGPAPKSSVSLDDPGRVFDPARRSPQHAELAALGVGAGKLAMLAPVEAKSVLGSIRLGTKNDPAQVRAQVDGYFHWRDLADSGPLHVYRAERIESEAARQFEAARHAWWNAAQGLQGGEPGAVEREAAAQADLSEAVRRHDAAVTDLRYLTDPAYREPGDEQPDVVTLGEADRLAAIARFTDPKYRGQVF